MASHLPAHLCRLNSYMQYHQLSSAQFSHEACRVTSSEKYELMTLVTNCRRSTAACLYRRLEEESVTRLQLFLCAGDLPQFFSGCTLPSHDEVQNYSRLFEIRYRLDPVFTVNQFIAIKKCRQKRPVLSMSCSENCLSKTATKCGPAGNVFRCVPHDLM